VAELEWLLLCDASFHSFSPLFQPSPSQSADEQNEEKSSLAKKGERKT
jgi:hypothetical protein